MTFLKRIFLFVLVNVLVIFTISSIINIFHLAPYLTRYGINYESLLIFCTLWGMGGAFISLLISKPLVKMMMRIKVIKENNTSENAQFLFETVENLSSKVFIKMPEVGIFQSNEVNAFATGFSKNNSLIAVSTALLEKLPKEQVEAIIGHEMSHITNGDMVTMTLVQGIVNAFVMFFARILAFFLTSSGNRNNRSSGMSFYLFTYLFEIMFMLLGSIAVCKFSRNREFRADLGGANLTNKEQMIAALNSLKSLQEVKDTSKSTALVNTLKISSNKKRGLSLLFATHPPLDERIEKLQQF